MNYYGALLVLTIFAINDVQSWRSFYVTFNSVSCVKKSNLMSYLNCSLERINRQQAGFSFHMEFAEDMQKPHLTSFFLYPRKNGPDFILLNATKVDCCQFFQRKDGVNILRLIRNEFDKFGSVPQCPVKKGDAIHLNKFFVDAHLMPAYMPESQFYGRFSIGSENTALFEFIANGSIVQKNKNFKVPRN